ncbi:MAG: Gfo/Idh/MocA family oxidoreductase [Candidatus Nitrosotenuis sp.]
MKVGVIGVGYWGKKHVEEYHNLGHDVVVFDPAKDNVDFCREKFNAIPVTNHIEILQDKEIQSVSICTPNSTHHSLVVEALNAGKNILVEKPISINMRDCEEIIRLAESKNLILLVGHIFRFNNAIKKARELVRSDDFGKIYTVNLKWTNLEPIFLDRDILFDLGVHPIDIVDNILEGYVTDIFCMAEGFRQKNYEYATINYKLISPLNETPIIVNVELSWLDPIKKRTLTLVGSRNTLLVDCFLQKIQLIDNTSKKLKNVGIVANNTIRDELEFFTNSVRQKKQIEHPMPTGDIAKRVLEVIEKAKMSIHD